MIYDGDDLREARLELGYTVTELAVALRMKPESGNRTIRRIEAGDKEVTGPIAVAVEAMLEGFAPEHMEDEG
jgi:predicted transcriptional regulator